MVHKEVGMYCARCRVPFMEQLHHSSQKPPSFPSSSTKSVCIILPYEVNKSTGALSRELNSEEGQRYENASWEVNVGRHDGSDLGAQICGGWCIELRCDSQLFISFTHRLTSYQHRTRKATVIHFKSLLSRLSAHRTSVSLLPSTTLSSVSLIPSTDIRKGAFLFLPSRIAFFILTFRRFTANAYSRQPFVSRRRTSLPTSSSHSVHVASPSA